MNKNNVIINNKLVRTTFKDYDGKYWCWIKKEEHPEFNRKYNKSYHCYRCKEEFIFFHDKEHPYTDNPPFKFHNILTKQLEKKENDWKTGRKTKVYQAICCKCAKVDKEINYCGCDFWIKDQREQENRYLEETNAKIAQSKELIKHLETKLIDEDSYLSYRVSKYLAEEEKELEDSEKRCNTAKRYLNNLAIWEQKLNEIKKAT